MTDPQHCRGSIKHRLSFAARPWQGAEKDLAAVY